MSLKSDLLDVLGMLKPNIDPTKGQLELDSTVKSISAFLSQYEGLYWLEYIIAQLDCGKLPLYAANKYVPKNKLDSLIEILYKSDKIEELKFLLLYYHQFFRQDEALDGSRMFLTLKKLADSGITQSPPPVVASFCLRCFYTSCEQFHVCPLCSDDDIFNVLAVSFPNQVKTILKNGQYLEVYAKHCFQEAGIELIGYPIDAKGKKAFTNVRYQVDGDPMEVDVHGVADPLTLLLCEVKTVAKVTSNDIRRVDGLYDHLIEKINTTSGRKFSVLKLFIITGEFDSNISESAYKRKGWELIDRKKINSLKEEIKRVQTEL